MAKPLASQQSPGALLDQSSTSAFESLLAELTSPENDKRQAAENAFENLHSSIDSLAAQIMRTLASSQVKDSRMMSAIMLKRSLLRERGKGWANLSENSKDAVKRESLRLLGAEGDDNVANKICDFISDLAIHLQAARNEKWEEMLTFMFTSVSDSSEENASKQTRSLQLFADTADILVNEVRSYLGTLHQVISSCLSSSHPSVRCAAVKAVASFLDALDDEARASLRSLAPEMVNALMMTLRKSDDETAQEMLSSFITLAETDPRFVRKDLQHYVDVFMSIINNNDEVESDTKIAAAEFMVTLAEAKEAAPGMVRRLSAFSEQLVSSLVTRFLVDVEDDAEWHSAEGEDGDAGDGELYDAGREDLDRLAVALGGRCILPVASATVPPLLQASDWRRRQAGLMALAQIAEGCAKQMKRQLGDSVAPALALVNDEVPRVRWAAVNCLGQMGTDLSDDLQASQEGHAVLSALGERLNDASARVRAHSATAIVNFCEEAEREVVEKHSNNLMNALQRMVVSSKGEVRMCVENACTAVASVADSMRDGFVRHYGHIMPALRSLVENAHNRKDHTMVAKAVECISLVGMAVGKETFQRDAQGVMDMLVQLRNEASQSKSMQTQATSNNSNETTTKTKASGEEDGEEDREWHDTTLQYTMQAFARICRALKKDFVPYLHIALPPVLNEAAKQPDATLVDSEAMLSDATAAESMLSGQIVTAEAPKGSENEGRLVQIKTSALQEKAQATSLVSIYVEELQEEILPYLDTITSMVLGEGSQQASSSNQPLLSFQLSEEVRKAAAESLPDLAAAALAAAERGMCTNEYASMFIRDHVIKAAMERMLAEEDAETMSAVLQSVSKMVSKCRHIVDQDMQHSISRAAMRCMKHASDSTRMRETRRNVEDLTEEDRQELIDEDNEDENEVLDEAIDVFTELLKSFQADFLPVLDSHIMDTLLTDFANSSSSAEEKRAVSCVMDDIIEHACSHSSDALCQKYFSFCSQRLLQFASEESDVHLLQSACFGLGVAADKCPAMLASLAERVQSALERVAARFSQSPNEASDNAASSLMKMHEKFQTPSLPSRKPMECPPGSLSRSAEIAVSLLPLTNDAEEAIALHQRFCRLVDMDDPGVLGGQFSNLPTVLSRIAKIIVLDSKHVTNETRLGLLNALKKMQATVNQDILSDAWSRVDSNDQSNIKAALNASPSESDR